MTQLGIAIGLVLVLEGVLYALFPVALQRWMAYALEMGPAALRRAGLLSAFAGFAIVWLIKG